MSKIFLLPLLLFATCQFAFSNVITLTKDNSIVFDQQFTSKSVATKQIELLELVSKRTNKEDPIYLVLNTPGGSVPAGNRFIETVQALDVPVHTITIFAASMGYHVVQSLGTRYILPSGSLMSHRVRIGGLSGQVVGEANTRLQMITDISSYMDSVVAERIKMSLSDYQKLIHDEYWAHGVKAVKENHADEVTLVKCDASLNGTKQVTFRNFFGSATVTLSKCPLTVGPIDVDASNEDIYKEVTEYFNNKPLFINKKFSLE